jgi:hypothetical protein
MRKVTMVGKPERRGKWKEKNSSLLNHGLAEPFLAA